MIPNFGPLLCISGVYNVDWTRNLQNTQALIINVCAQFEALFIKFQKKNKFYRLF
jgi:hypothetical protein